MLEYVGFVDRGLVHQTDDDAAMLNHSVIHEGFFSGRSMENRGLFAVADGVGSVPHSEMASRCALSELRECHAEDLEEIRLQICRANDHLIELAHKLEFQQVPSTTLCLVSISEDKMISFNLGNSRLYRFRKGYLRQMTKDQTKVQDLIDAGALNHENAFLHPEKNVISKFLGSQVFLREWIDIQEHKEIFQQGDILLICTDGISDYLNIDFLENILTEESSLGEKARKMIQGSRDAGGNDNATVVLIRNL